ncbi:MAG: serine hydrolase domain-containing protein [Bacteroidota bacterium]|nr:serine hydrolase domain-containing protein [Bacteroidota bacterium]MDP4233010.1 serine hydrolase domain-containing protein [Bacteroidota bacterium]MDP4241845.1 serine hydrolase domain-containing protein [Bacteroidota bacterium]MDP4288394.1 serine hydrolase domain-containing protein [Bacteroidota bacterium]
MKLVLFGAILFVFATDMHAQSETTASITVREALQTACSKHALPAMGIAVIAADTLALVDVTGLRKLGDTARERLNDLWHIGSDTKAFTAAMIARLVDSHALTYQSTIGQLFPELQGKILPGYDTITLETLLEHRAGLWHDWPQALSRKLFDAYRGPLRDQRLKLLTTLLAYPPEFKPGSKYSYSNAGYVIATAMAERAANTEYERLMDSLVFQPLGITSAGWGLMNTRSTNDNTWEHEDRAGRLIPIDNVLSADNPALMNPAGRLHLSLEDWSKFIRLFLPGSTMHLPGLNLGRFFDKLAYIRSDSMDYRDGWIITNRSWAGGIALNHAGSNTMNFVNVWVAPSKHFAVMVTCNAGNDAAVQAAEEVIGAAIRAYLQ